MSLIAFYSNSHNGRNIRWKTGEHRTCYGAFIVHTREQQQNSADKGLQARLSIPFFFLFHLASSFFFLLLFMTNDNVIPNHTHFFVNAHLGTPSRWPGPQDLHPGCSAPRRRIVDHRHRPAPCKYHPLMPCNL